MQDTIAQLTGVKAEVVLIHLNHTNPLLSTHSPERAEAMAGGFTVSWDVALPTHTCLVLIFLPGLVVIRRALAAFVWVVFPAASDAMPPSISRGHQAARIE